MNVLEEQLKKQEEGLGSFAIGCLVSGTAVQPASNDGGVVKTAN